MSSRRSSSTSHSSSRKSSSSSSSHSSSSSRKESSDSKKDVAPKVTKSSESSSSKSGTYSQVSAKEAMQKAFGNKVQTSIDVTKSSKTAPTPSEQWKPVSQTTASKTAPAPSAKTTSSQPAKTATTAKPTPAQQFQAAPKPVSQQVKAAPTQPAKAAPVSQSKSTPAVTKPSQPVSKPTAAVAKTSQPIPSLAKPASQPVSKSATAIAKPAPAPSKAPAPSQDVEMTEENKLSEEEIEEMKAKFYKGDNRTLFVKPLPTDVTAEAIKKFFDTRHIVEVRVPDKLVYRGPRRFAFVVFDTPEAMERQMQLKEDAEFEGNKIFMDYTDERSSFPPREPKKPKKEKPELSTDPNNPNIATKSPISHLNEIKNGIGYELKEITGEDHMKMFTMSVTIDGQEFTGKASCKKLAKAEAAKQALIQLYNFKVPPLGPPREKTASEAGEDGENGEQRGEKRSLEDGDDDNEYLPIAKKKKKKRSNPTDGKNAIQKLNEFKYGVTFDVVSQTGPIHAPEFTVQTEIDGEVFTGVGCSKKEAKLAAAEAALNSGLELVRPPPPMYPPMRGRFRPKPQKMYMDFTSDNPGIFMSDFDGPPGGYYDYGGPGYNEPMEEDEFGMPVQHYYPKKMRLPLDEGEAQKPARSAIMILNELRPGLNYEVIGETGESHDKCFTMVTTVDGERFEGQGRNKKIARTKAAEAALAKIFNLRFSEIDDGEDDEEGTNADGKMDTEETPSPLADACSKLILDKLSDLTDGLKTQYARRRVLAGLVMTQGNNIESAKVICIATGTKCINGEYFSNKGTQVNDFHAEILVRRSLLRYLYSQLDLIASGNPVKADQSIFERREKGRGYKVKDEIKFHLYISVAPCGDSRIFSQEGEEEMDTGDPNRKTSGKLRTKIESGEGTIPVKASEGIQTWEGVMQGERLLTMSCSDKIARWNILGIQGALLSHYVEPIYLNSIFLGSLYHREHLTRALYGRLAGAQDFPLPYHARQPSLSGISNPESRQIGKAPNFAVSWCAGDGALEVINTTTGKTEAGSESQLCKRELFKRYLALHGKLSSAVEKKVKPKMYRTAKEMCVEYKRAKEELVKHFNDNGYGQWVKKPVEQDMFSADS